MFGHYERLIEEVLDRFVREQARKLTAKEEEIRLIIKVHKGELGLFLYNKAKYVRKVKTDELLEKITE